MRISDLSSDVCSSDLRQAGLFRPGLTARHRRVDAVQPSAFALHEQLPRDPRRYRGMINEEAARLHRAEGAVAAQGDLAQIVVGADATDDDLRILGRLGRVDRDRAAIGLRPALRLRSEEHTSELQSL